MTRHWIIRLTLRRFFWYPASLPFGRRTYLCDRMGTWAEIYHAIEQFLELDDVLEVEILGDADLLHV